MRLYLPINRVPHSFMSMFQKGKNFGTSTKEAVKIQFKPKRLLLKYTIVYL